MPKNKNVIAIQGTAVKANGTYIVPVLIDDTLCLKFAEQADSKWGKTLGYSTLQRVLDNADVIKRIMGANDANTIKAQAESAAIVVNSAAVAPMKSDGTISQMAVMAYLTEKYGFNAKQANEFSTNDAAIKEASAFYAAQKQEIAQSPADAFAQAKANAAHISATPSVNHAARVEKVGANATGQVREIVAKSVATQAVVTGDVFQSFVRKYPYGSESGKINQADWQALNESERKQYLHNQGLFWDKKLASNDNAVVIQAPAPPAKKEKIAIQYSVKIRDAAGNANENVLTAQTKRDAVVALDGKKLVTFALLNGKPAKADYTVQTSAQDANANHKYAQLLRDGYIVEL